MTVDKDLQELTQRRADNKKAARKLKRDVANGKKNARGWAWEEYQASLKKLDKERKSLSRRIQQLRLLPLGRGKFAVCPCCCEPMCKQYFKEVYEGADLVCNACAKAFKAAGGEA